MASTKVKGIVLGGTNVKEKDKIIKLYTLEKGPMSVTLKGVRGDKAKYKAAKEIFCFGDFVIEEGKNYSIVTSVDIIDNFYMLSNNIERYYEACAILDIVSKVATEPNTALFIEILEALKTLCYDEVGKYNVIDKFLISIFKAMGYNFITENCSSCGGKLGAKYLNLGIGEIVCPACKKTNSLPISDACFNALKILSNTEYDKLPTINFSLLIGNQVHYLLTTNYEWRTGYKVLSIV